METTLSDVDKMLGTPRAAYLNLMGVSNVGVPHQVAAALILPVLVGSLLGGRKGATLGAAFVAYVLVW